VARSSKVALWSGGDLMRKPEVTADLVHLALDGSGIAAVHPDQHQRRRDTLISIIAASACHARIPIRHSGQPSA
jgi:hypothetical protein